MDFHRQWAATCRPARLLSFVAGDPGQIPVTKVGGNPWWPAGMARPSCSLGHDMGFVAQVALRDVPGAEADGGLLSLHYCADCMWDGNMAFGWSERDRAHGAAQRGYCCAVFEDVAARCADGVAILGETTVPACVVSFEAVEDFQDPEDHDDEDTAATVPYHVREATGVRDFIGDGDESDITLFYISKVGGWPGWVQDSEWPSCPHGEPMAFVAQLDADIGEASAWAAGGLAYLFICRRSCPERHGELVIQTT